MKNCSNHKGKEKEKISNFGDRTIVEETLDIVDVLSITINNSGDEWILDSGCSYHIFPNRDWFSTYQLIGGGKDPVGNDIAYKVVGIYIIRIKMHDNITKTLTNVSHIPKLKKKLISLGTLDFNECTYKVRGGVSRISKGTLVMMKGKKIDSLYKL